MLTLAHFLQTLSTYEATGAEPAVSRVVMDSREVVPSSLFVAYKGEKVDGHDYVAAAFEQGAIAALVDRPLSDAYTTIDLRNAEPPTVPHGASAPVCLIVEDSIAALQTSAKAWRARFPAEVIGITGSVGKTSTKELTHAVLSRPVPHLSNRPATATASWACLWRCLTCKRAMKKRCWRWACTPQAKLLPCAT